MKTFEDFQRAFPGLFGRPYSEGGPFIGFECPPGWTDLVWTLCQHLEPLGVQAQQVKEKFGELRFYYVGYDPERVEPLITEAEKQSARTCQVCGEPGSPEKKGHWVATLCAAHLAEWQQQGALVRLYHPEDKA